MTVTELTPTPDPTVRVIDATLVADGWHCADPGLVAHFSGLPGDAAEVELARLACLGLLVDQRVGTAVDLAEVDRVVNDSFGQVVHRIDEILGDGGELDARFDADRDGSVPRIIRDLVAEAVEAERATLVGELDHSVPGTAAHRSHQDLASRLDGINGLLHDQQEVDAADAARADERSRGTQKGGDHEDLILGALADAAFPFADAVEATASITGPGGNCKGDLVITVDPVDTAGVATRIAVEAKDSSQWASQATGARRSTGTRQLNDFLTTELDAAMANREAGAAIGVFAHLDQFPPGAIAPLSIHGNRILCVLEADGPLGSLSLRIAYQLARRIAVGAARDQAGDEALDVEAVIAGVQRLADKIRSLSNLKTNITTLSSHNADTLGSLHAEVCNLQDALRDEVADLQALLAESS